MASNPSVRHIGSVTDDLGVPVAIGTDHAAVTVGPYMLGPQAREDFKRLFFAAGEEAKAYAALERAEAAEEALWAAREAQEQAGAVSADG